MPGAQRLLLVPRFYLSACGTLSCTPDPSTAKALPAPVTQVPASFELTSDAAVVRGLEELYRGMIKGLPPRTP